jgi:hypothetical protein
MPYITELLQRQSGGHRMIRIGPVSVALSGWIVFCVAFALLLPSAANADEEKGDVVPKPPTGFNPHK